MRGPAEPGTFVGRTLLYLSLDWRNPAKANLSANRVSMSQRMLIASCLAIGMIGRLEFKPIHDTDIFWQVKLGQIMLDRAPNSDRGSVHLHPRRRAGPADWLARASNLRFGSSEQVAGG